MVVSASSILSFIFACFVSLFSVTYSLRVPYRLTQSPLVKEYYETNYVTSIPIDLLFIGCYFVAALQIANALGMNTYIEKLMIVGLTTAFLTSAFCFYFRSTPKTDNFFSRWFHAVGYASVLYDVILLMTVFVVYSYMCDASSQALSLD